MKSKYFRFLVIALLSVVLMVSFSPTDRHFEIARNMEIFASLYKEVNHYYVEDVNPSELAESAINAMLGSLDPYTNYIPEDRIEDYRTMTTGEYAGIGAKLEEIDGKYIIMMPVQGYAADKAGLLIGDELLEIDGSDITDRPLEYVQRMLKGQAGNAINLKVRRYGAEKPLEFRLIHEKVREYNVPYYGMVTEDVGLIQLTDFTQKAGLEVKNALVALKDQGAEKVILDLRGNPGGLLNEAINITNIFLPRGSEIVSMRGRTKDWSKNYRALNAAVDTEIPLAVLIDQNSASASEIVSGVIQDYDRGVLVGQRSFGKGLVQTTTGLSFNSQLKVTVAKYYIPSERCIQAIDYSQRNEDGTAVKLADSLRQVFYTQAGREVFDGAGIDPDVETPLPVLAPITKSLIKENLIFEYANIFRAENEAIDSARDFRLSDEQYQDFVNWLNAQKFDYTTGVEKSLADLVASAQYERYYENIEVQIDKLGQEISHNKNADLQTFKEQIKELLEKEICTRYYLQRGEMEASFNDDPSILTALEVLDDQQRYKALLSPRQ